MRAEDIVGMSFFAVLIPGIVVTIAGSRSSLAARQKALWRCCGLCLISGALLGFGLVSLQMIRSSPWPVIQGNLWDVRELYSSKEHSTRFMITGADGHAVLIRCKYTGPGLVEGERARVRYVAYSGKLVELDMLDGPFQGWHLQEGSGEAGNWGWVGLGVICGLFAYGHSRKARVG